MHELPTTTTTTPVRDDDDDDAERNGENIYVVYSPSPSTTGRRANVRDPSSRNPAKIQKCARQRARSRTLEWMRCRPTDDPGAVGSEKRRKYIGTKKRNSNDAPTRPSTRRIASSIARNAMRFERDTLERFSFNPHNLYSLCDD